MPALDEAGIVNTLIAALKRDTPHCVSAAAGVLGLIAGVPMRAAGGHKLVEAGGAIPALVHLIQRAIPPGDLADDTGLYRRCAHEHRSP